MPEDQRDRPDDPHRHIVRRRGGGRALVIAQRMPMNSRSGRSAFDSLASLAITPIGRFFEAQEMNFAPARESFEISEHLALAERLEHSVIADVQNALGHEVPIRRLTTSATPLRQSRAPIPNSASK